MLTNIHVESMWRTIEVLQHSSDANDDATRWDKIIEMSQAESCTLSYTRSQPLTHDNTQQHHGAAGSAGIIIHLFFMTLRNAICYSNVLPVNECVNSASGEEHTADWGWRCSESGDDVDLESSEAFSCHAISPHTLMGGDQKKRTEKKKKIVFSSLSLVYIQYIFDSAECVSEWRNFIDTAQSTAAAAAECCVYGAEKIVPGEERDETFVQHRSREITMHNHKEEKRSFRRLCICIKCVWMV